MKKYTKKQIVEAISYWEKQIRLGNYKKINESYESYKLDDLRDLASQELFTYDNIPNYAKKFILDGVMEDVENGVVNLNSSGTKQYYDTDEDTYEEMDIDDSSDKSLLKYIKLYIPEFMDSRDVTVEYVRVTDNDNNEYYVPVKTKIELQSIFTIDDVKYKLKDIEEFYHVFSKGSGVASKDIADIEPVFITIKFKRQGIQFYWIDERFEKDEYSNINTYKYKKKPLYTKELSRIENFDEDGNATSVYDGLTGETYIPGPDGTVFK